MSETKRRPRLFRAINQVTANALRTGKVGCWPGKEEDNLPKNDATMYTKRKHVTKLATMFRCWHHPSRLFGFHGAELGVGSGRPVKRGQCFSYGDALLDRRARGTNACFPASMGPCGDEQPHGSTDSGPWITKATSECPAIT